ncbi:hypothetical protein Pla123a_33480 [Posidoniimonas polymericola]|uniref:Uncharacterized protein n=1 Tax=Posidoniimonas polymericola TaxID=2528002 RepID=A0A5C5YHT7_9BACT|nr:hypothetical protein [Posidoniimonas polymericola]TWT74525.1 hypothetical protein Pla123a_33480 [Posidoniimonas polymericola]
MDLSKQKELERVFSSCADDGPTPEQAAKLERLLRDDPDLQEHYAKLVGVHVLLDAEVRLSGRRAQLPLDGAAPATCELVATHINADLGRTRSPWFTPSVLATLAAALVAAFWLGRSTNDTGPPAAQSRPARTAAAEDLLREDGLVISNDESLARLGYLLRDAGITSVRLPRCGGSADQQFTLCSGAAWYDRPARKKERGYLVSLRPGERMDVYFDTDAMGRNSLAIAEFDASGKLTGRTLQFNNLPSGVSKVRQSRAGMVGEFSEWNDSPYSRHYLFTGSHMLYDGLEEEVWRQSDFEVSLDHDGLMVLGWDDSGYSGMLREGEHDSPPDRDYNDIRAMIKFTSADSGVHGTEQSVSYYPLPEPSDIRANPDARGYIIDVRPGERVLLAASSDARWQNSLQIIEADSGRVVWRHDGSAPVQGARQQRNRGAYVITNHSDRARRYFIYGRHRRPSEDSDDAWIDTDFEVLASDDRSAVVGFNDTSGSLPADDWDDLRVVARWFGD